MDAPADKVILEGIFFHAASHWKADLKECIYCQRNYNQQTSILVTYYQCLKYGGITAQMGSDKL